MRVNQEILGFKFRKTAANDVRYDIKTVLELEHGADTQRARFFAVPNLLPLTMFIDSVDFVCLVVGDANKGRQPSIEAVEKIVDGFKTQPSVGGKDL